MLNIFKNSAFTGNPFSFLDDAFRIDLSYADDGQQVLTITEYTHATDPSDTRFNKPEIKAVITGTDLLWNAVPNDPNYSSLGQTLDFTGGTISSIVINDYVGGGLGTLGEPREVYSLTGGEVDAQMLNLPIDEISGELDALTVPGGYIVGTAGDDDIEGSAGDDFIDGVSGNDTINGNAGDDVILVKGTLDEETYFGGVTVNGGDGNDTIISSSDIPEIEDIIFGGAGDDYIQGGLGLLEAHGGNGNDVIIGAFEGNTLYGDAGNDTLIGGEFDDVLHGGAGDDYIQGGLGFLEAHGGSGNDVIIGAFHENTLYGDVGNDTLVGGEFDDILHGGSGNDYIMGGEGGNDDFIGGDGNDYLDGTSIYDDDADFQDESGGDFYAGGKGDDAILLGSGNDYILFQDDGHGTSYGNDTVFGFETGSDTIIMEGSDVTSQSAQAASTQSEAGVHIVLGETSLLLDGLTMDDVDFETDFIYASSHADAA